MSVSAASGPVSYPSRERGAEVARQPGTPLRRESPGASRIRGEGWVAAATVGNLSPDTNKTPLEPNLPPVSSKTPVKPSPSQVERSVVNSYPHDGQAAGQRDVAHSLPFEPPLYGGNGAGPPEPPAKHEPTPGEPEPTPRELIAQARARAKEALHEHYPVKGYVHFDTGIEGEIADKVVDHVAGMAEDAVRLAEHWPKIAPAMRRLVPAETPDETIKVLDHVDNIAWVYLRVREGYPLYYFAEDMPIEERTERVQRGITRGFEASIRALVPDPAESSVLVNAYGWVDGRFQSLVPIEGSFSTVLPHARIAQTLRSSFEPDPGEMRSKWQTPRPRLTFSVKNSPDKSAVDIRNN